MSGSDLLKRYNEHKKKTQSETVSNTTNANTSVSKSSGSDLLERYKKYKEQSIGAPVAEYEDPLTEEKIAERRALYQSNADRIADLETTYKDASNISQAIYDRSNALLYGAQRGGNIRATMDEATANDTTIAELKKQLETYGDVDALKKEMEELKAANLRYQREQKELDNYFVPITKDFLENAAYRDYGNPTKQDIEAYAMANGDTAALIGAGYDLTKDGWRDKDGNLIEINFDAKDPVVKDKLGFYLDNRNNTESVHSDYALTFMGEAMTEGRSGSWEYLKDNEIDIYYNLLKTEGQEAAYKFLDAMQTTLNKRATQEMAKKVADAGVGAQIAYNVASVPANVLGGAGSFIDDALHMIRGEDINPYSYGHRWQNFAQAVREDTASDINEWTGNAALPYVGTTFGDVYQALMSGVDSAVGIGLGGTTYGILMGMGAASSEAKELYEKGASMWQIAAGGILAGAAEMVFEKVSIDHFVKMGDVKSVKTFIVNTLKQGGVEASEEVLTEIANTLSDAVVMGTQSDWQGYVDQYVSEGYSESEAIVKALFKDVAPNVINAGIGGFISGGGMGSIGSLGSYANYQSQVKKHGQGVIKQGGVDTLKALAEDMAGVRAVSRASSKVNSKASAKNVGGLSVAIEEAMSAQNKADIESALVEKGLSKSEAKRITEYLTGTAELTAEQKAEINNNKQVAEVVAEFVKNSDSTLNQRKLNLMAARLGVKLNDKKATTTGEVAVNKELNLKDKISAKKQTTNEATGEAIVIDKNNAIAKVEDGKVYYNTDKGVVPLTDVTYASEEEGVLYEGLSDLNPAIANALISNYDGKISARAYVNGVREGVLLYGKNNFQGIGKDIPGDTYFSDLSETDQNLALKLGREYAKIEATKAEGNLKTAIKNAAERAEADKASGKKVAEGKVRFESNVDGGKLNRTQRRTVSLAKHLAKAIGIDIVFYDAMTTKNKNGKGANGYFDSKTNSIHLDLQNAVTDSKTIAFTLSHELVHFIKKWSPAKFKAFADFLMEQYAAHGVSTSTLLANKMAALGTTDADLAYEEMIADACERMLLDSNAVVKLMELRKSDLELFEKIKLHVLEILNKIRNAFKGVDPNTEEGIALQKMEDVLGKLHEMFEDAAVDAAKTYGEASKYGAREVYREARSLTIGSRNLAELSEAQNTEGEPLFQYKAIQADEKAYREMLTKWGKMTNAQIDNLFATIDTAIELIKDNLEALDYAWEADIDDRAFSPVKANSDKLYKVSLDFSTLCRKRLLQQTVQVQLQEALNQPLTKEEGIAIRDALIAIQEEGRQIEVACALCYVESARMKSPEQIKKFMNNKEQVIKEFFAGKNGGTMKEKIAKAEADARETLAKENPNGIKGKDGKTMVDPLTAKLKELPKKYADVIRDAKREAKASYNPTPEEQKLIDVAMDMTVSDFTSPKGLENLAKNYPALFDAYTSYVRNATKSKGIEGDVWWRAGDSKKIGDVLIATMNKENGLRSQSWSDFQVVHILDYIAATIELATREAKEQAYTKVPDFAELMGKTGVMINLSLIPTAKFNGKLEYDGVEGMAYKRALELRDKYPDTVGTICIGISNEQIKMLLADMTIDYVIPYHKSGMSAVIRKAMHIPTWDQYEDYQGEKELSRAEAQKRADKYGVKLLAENDPNYHKGTSFSEWFDLKEAQQIAKMENANPSDKAKQKEYGIMYGGYMAMQNAAQNYLKLCAERGLAPKFSYEKADFTAEDNYWKLLIDRKMVNNATGEVIEQQTIKPIFEESEIMRILNDELERYPKVKEDQEYAIRRVTEAYLSGNLKGGMSANAIAEVMKKPVDNVTNVNILASAEDIDEGVKKQVKRATDKDYLDAVNRGDMETAQRMVDEAAREAGYSTEHLYHGTSMFGFTDIDVSSASDDSISFFATNRQEVASGYMPWYEDDASDRYHNDVRRIGVPDKSRPRGLSRSYDAERILTEARKVFPEYKDARVATDAEILTDLKTYWLTETIEAAEKLRDIELSIGSNKLRQQVRDMCDAVITASKEDTLDAWKVVGNRYKEFDGINIPYDANDMRPQIFRSRILSGLQRIETLSKTTAIMLNGQLTSTASIVDSYNSFLGGETLGMYDLYAKRDNQLVIQGRGSSWDQLPLGKHEAEYRAWLGEDASSDSASKRVTTRDIAAFAKAKGYRSVAFFDIYDNGVYGSAADISDVYAFFHPNEDVKSADPVTYDDEGNVIPLSERFNAENDDIRYQKKPVSNRSLLANALESAAQNDIEKNKLAQYKSKIELIESEQAKLAEVRAKANEIRFTKGRTPDETKKMKALDFEANQIANRINTYDRQLLNLESTTALKNVLQREKAQAYKRAEQKGKEALAAYKEKSAKTTRELMNRYQESRKKGIDSRNKTEMRHKIKDIVSKLNSLLLDPTKDKHVPIGLQKPVAAALDIINMDTVGAEERIAKYDALIAKEKNPDVIESLKQSRDRIALQGESLSDKLTALKAAYAEIKNSEDQLIKNSHNEAIESLIDNTIDKVGNTAIRDMSLAQLESVYDMFKAIKATVRNANKMFKEGRQETVTENSERVKTEVRNAGGHRDRVLKATKFLKKFGWNMLKPIYAMKLIGSNTFTRLYENVRKGEDTWAVDVNEAKEFFQEKRKKYNYDSWDFKKLYTFKDSAGKSFSLSLEQIMSLYAYSKREQADLHLEKGGFIFDDAIEITIKNKLGVPMKYEVNDANPYRLNKEDLGAVIGILDTDLKDVKGFVDEMQAYLSDVMGAKGNEVSLAMYDIKLYNEKHYFPLKTAKYFREFDPEKNGTPKIRNSGFSKKTIPKAGNPIVLSNFMDVWANHVNDMSMYHAFVLPLEDFMRVYNYSSTAGGYDSVQQYIKNAYGSQTNTYIETLMNDLNGGARTDPATDLIGKAMSLFKKSAVFASASVVIQQPSAIARALAYIDPKYFVDKPEATKHKETWAEVKKYAPVAIIKEMGYFDTNMGRSTVDWIRDEKNLMDKIDDVASKAPALADELSWCAIWKAVKREIAATTKLKVGSEEFLEAAGKRFTDVVTKTQVYDSVLSRSALMRSKDTGAKMFTAFMAEPTTALNMAVDAIIEGKRGNKKFAGKVFGAVSASIILNSILVSLVTAARDDDDDETYTEKYLESLTAELIDGFNPLTYVPFVKDVWSIMQGYDIERSDMSIWSDLWQSVENLFSDNKSGFEKTEGIVGSIASIFGLPLKNLMRDARAMYNLATTLLSGTPTTRAGVGEAIGGAVKSSIPLYTRIEKWAGADESKSDKLYDAIMDGDKAHTERLKSGYKTESAYLTALRTALRENDPRIAEAAKARISGNIAEYTRIAKLIIAEKHFSQDDVVAAINAEINAIKKGESQEEETPKDEATSIYRGSDVNAAFEYGDNALAKSIIDDLIKTKVANGMEEKNAKSSVRSSMTSYWKPLYIAAYKANNQDEMYRIRMILKTSGIYGSAADVINTCRGWLNEK